MKSFFLNFNHLPSSGEFSEKTEVKWKTIITSIRYGLFLSRNVNFDFILVAVSRNGICPVHKHRPLYKGCNKGFPFLNCIFFNTRSEKRRTSYQHLSCMPSMYCLAAWRSRLADFLLGCNAIFQFFSIVWEDCVTRQSHVLSDCHVVLRDFCNRLYILFYFTAHQASVEAYRGFIDKTSSQ